MFAFRLILFNVAFCVNPTVHTNVRTMTFCTTATLYNLVYAEVLD